MGENSLAFTYDADGTRRTKLYSYEGGSKAHSYICDGNRVIFETVTTTEGETSTTSVIEYLYDESGSAIGFVYSGNEYYFTKSLQGDVQRIYNTSGEVVGEYRYDAWGKILNESSLSQLAQLNPFRYRGYYYDSETALYYVSSRYYDPETGRWINADGYVSTGQGALGNNMFAYCGNNPVNRVDYTGQFWSEIW